MPKSIKEAKNRMMNCKTNSKPDYIDIDGDGNKTESMKEAAKDAKKKPKSKNPFTRKD